MAYRNADDTISITRFGGEVINLNPNEAREIYYLIDREYAEEDVILVLQNDLEFLETEKEKYPNAFDESEDKQIELYKRCLNDDLLLRDIVSCYIDDFRCSDDDNWRYEIKEAIRVVAREREVSTND